METTVTLDERHYRAAVEKARELGKTPGRYIESLIEAATSSFDEILEPVREAFRNSGVSEAELEDTVTKARKAIHEASGSNAGQ